MNVPIVVDHAHTLVKPTAPTAIDTTALVAELSARASLDPIERLLLEIVKNTYRWHNEINKQQAMNFLRALLTAYRHALDHQVRLLTVQLLKLVAKDQVGKVEALVFQHLNYHGLSYVVPDGEPIPTHSFRVPIRSDFVTDLLNAFSLEAAEYEWQLDPIHTWDRAIPPHALMAIELLDQHQITPTYWVADKLRVRRYERISVDPQLVAQFFNVFVGLCEWA